MVQATRLNTLVRLCYCWRGRLLHSWLSFGSGIFDSLDASPLSLLLYLPRVAVAH